jgi:predicted nucleotidyltransferase component of viral defense system
VNLAAIRESYIKEGLGYLDAQARTCQDIILVLIAKSPLARNVTIKGGVVLQHISQDNRRATQDIDFDFIRYSIQDEAIKRFVHILDGASKDISVALTGNITELKHQDYSGKRLHIQISDCEGTTIDTKLDIGVHKDTDTNQEEYCFDIDCADGSVTLLVNSKEQIVVEKLKSLLNIGAFTTRYKDVFDLYYLLNIQSVDVIKLATLMRERIFEDRRCRENSMADIHKRLESTFDNQQFVARVKASKKNWLNVPYNQVTEGILRQFSD